MTAIVVPDASVLLKWVLPDAVEEDAGKALKLRQAALSGDIDLLVPSLWLYEVGNILALKFPDHADALLDSLLNFGLREANINSVWRQQVLNLTRKYRVTFYDAAYHASALVANGVFVTADKKYVKRAGAAGRVSLLMDYP